MKLWVSSSGKIYWADNTEAGNPCDYLEQQRPQSTQPSLQDITCTHFLHNHNTLSRDANFHIPKQIFQSKKLFLILIISMLNHAELWRSSGSFHAAGVESCSSTKDQHATHLKGCWDFPRVEIIFCYSPISWHSWIFNLCIILKRIKLV